MRREAIIAEVTWEFGEVPTDLSKCWACEDIIYGKTFGLFFFVNNIIVESDNGLKVCESCYDCLNHTE